MASLDGVGHTGLTVAAVRAQETARPDRLFADPLAAAFAAAGGLAPGAGPGGRRGAALRVWVVARTVFLDGLLAEAGQQGCRQVVLLGAGFDARAFRLPWPPGTRCFEVDTPDVLGPKDQVIAAERAVPGCERLVVPCDLRDDWPAALRATGLDPARPTAWIAEGLLVYLPPADVDRLLDTITGLSVRGSRLGLTMNTREAGSLDGTRLGTLRQSRAPDDPAGWLGARGWAAQITGLREVLRAHGRPLPEQTRAGQEDGARPKALLIRATLDQRHGAAGKPAAGPASGSAGRPLADQPAGGCTGPADPRARAGGPGETVLVADLRLSALLSQALVAFTIEFDNESGHRLPHRTTRGPAAHSGRGPWLVSLAMWADFMQFLPAGGVPLREVADLVPLTNLAGLERWGYVRSGPIRRTAAAPARDHVVRPTRWGRQAQPVWAPLTGVIEGRWRARAPGGAINGPAGALRALYAQPDGQEQPLIGAGLVPYPGGWRAHPPYQRLTEAMIADPARALPHYPMVSHRGGYPDGS